MRTAPLTAQGTLDVSGLAPGAYLDRMEEGEQVRTVPFIKQ